MRNKSSKRSPPRRKQSAIETRGSKAHSVAAPARSSPNPDSTKSQSRAKDIRLELREAAAARDPARQHKLFPRIALHRISYFLLRQKRATTPLRLRFGTDSADPSPDIA